MADTFRTMSVLRAPRAHSAAALPGGAHGVAMTPPVIAPVPVSVCRAPPFRRDWEELLATSTNLYVQYQSPQWLDHLDETGAPGVLPPVAVRDGQQLIGLAPITLGERQLTVALKGRSICTARLQAVSVLGSQPLLPRDPVLYDRLFAAVVASAPTAAGVYLHSVPDDTFLWSHLTGAMATAGHYFVYVPAGMRRFSVLALPDSFDTYLTQFNAKKRYNLARQVRVLNQYSHGTLRLQRVDRAPDVPRFMQAAHTIAGRSWQGRSMESGLGVRGQPQRLSDLAQRGLLRSYVLYSQDVPCAFVLGYQFGGVYHYAEIGYDQAFVRFSPGAVLLYLLIQDLFAHQAPRWVSFGIGDAAYKREFGNVERRDATVFLLRRTPINAWRIRVHHALQRLVQTAQDTWKGASGDKNRTNSARAGR